MAVFTVFDVETPNCRNDRISAIGITLIEDGVITGTFHSLVDPQTRFDTFNVRLTGISPESVIGKPAFPELWEHIEPMMSRGMLVAHNAPFDLGVLKKCLRDYGIFWKPYIRYVCTVQMGRQLLPGVSHRLDALSGYYGIPLDHHQADSDSRACAEILLRYIEDGADVRRFIRTCSLTK